MPEVAHSYARARELCQQVDETPQLFEILMGLCVFYPERGKLCTAHALAEQLLHLAQRLHDPIRVLWAHNTLGYTLFVMAVVVALVGHHLWQCGAGRGRAHPLLAEALDTIDPPGKRLEEAGLYRCKGELLLKLDAASHRHQARGQSLVAEAEECLHQSLALARRQQTRALRAAGRAEPESVMAATGQAGGSPTVASIGLRMVH